MSFHMKKNRYSWSLMINLKWVLGSQIFLKLLQHLLHHLPNESIFVARQQQERQFLYILKRSFFPHLQMTITD